MRACSSVSKVKCSYFIKKPMIIYFPVLAQYISHVGVSQNGLKSVKVYWEYSLYGVPVTGSLVSYKQQGGKQSGSVTVEGTDTGANITGLIAGATYHISVVVNSTTLPSNPTTTKFILSMSTLYE